ncbi:P-loop containing nucleoside triphosphate hydrolase protein [Cystobasidium minutum MCA 4210]|uniref:P-loop containing nucleoside triphosphate hydrolase protein n=1 Tax=Cystobasidium minutum MCA 4210 TaxID=1397322 RepID=UPI0034CE5C88|eukprot:jgi/Rhomi1/164877/fgenesh1_kg.1_\
MSDNIDDPVKRLGLAGPIGPLSGDGGGSLLGSLTRNWSRPTLSMVLLFASLQHYLKRILLLVGQSTPFGSLLPGGSTSSSSPTGGESGPLLAVGAWASFTLLSFIGAKFWSLYNYLDPLNSIFRHAYIDSRHTTQVESHKWLTSIIEASPKYKTSRDLDASNFQSVRDRETSGEEDRIRMNRWGEYNAGPSRVLEVIHDPAHPPEVPVYFLPRDVDDFWFFKFGTLFRVKKRAPRNIRRPSMGWDADADDFAQAEPAILVRAFCRTRKPLMKFLAWAKEEYEAGFKENLYLQTYTWDDYQWNASAMRMGRGFDTIIIPEETKQKLLDDVQEFLDSQDWYSSRGIPWKRGYIFHGPPGNGKSSSIAALASTFDLPVYTLPIANSGFSDSTLSRAVARLTSRCILVLEDLDAISMANAHRTNAGDALVPGSRRGKRRNRHAGGGVGSNPAGLGGEERLSLSAILNTLDGLSSGEGRIVIATTNHIEALDEALIRPGRFDCFIHYKKANREQARALFLQFYNDYKSKVEVLDKELDEAEEYEERLKLGAEEVQKLAEEFQAMVQEEEFSVAALQGHLIAHKTNPYMAVREMPNFIADSKKPKESADKFEEYLQSKLENDLKAPRDSVAHPLQNRRGSF